MFAITVVM